MIKGCFLICLLGALVSSPPKHLNGQKRNCMLIDSLNKEPVAFASISAGSFVCYSDQDGIFSTEELPDGPILISRLGYQSIEILKSELTSKVVLSPKRYSISEIEISGNAEAFELGYHELKTFGFSKMKNKYMAVLVQSPRKRCRIENVLVHIRKNRKGTDFVIGLFSVNDRGGTRRSDFFKRAQSTFGAQPT